MNNNTPRLRKGSLKSGDKVWTDPFCKHRVFVRIEGEFRDPELGILREFETPRQGRDIGFVFSSGS